LIGTVITVKAQPGIHAIDELILNTPLSVNHLLSGERGSFRSQRAGNRTGGTLVTLFQILTASFDDSLNKFQIRI
jgi:hypothetical protein